MFDFRNFKEIPQPSKCSSVYKCLPPGKLTYVFAPTFKQISSTRCSPLKLSLSKTALPSTQSLWRARYSQTAKTLTLDNSPIELISTANTDSTSALTGLKCGAFLYA